MSLADTWPGPNFSIVTSRAPAVTLRSRSQVHRLKLHSLVRSKDFLDYIPEDGIEHIFGENNFVSIKQIRFVYTDDPRIFILIMHLVLP